MVAEIVTPGLRRLENIYAFVIDASPEA